MATVEQVKKRKTRGCLFCKTKIVRRAGNGVTCLTRKCKLEFSSGKISPEDLEKALRAGVCPGCQRMLQGIIDPDTCGHGVCVNRGDPPK